MKIRRFIAGAIAVLLLGALAPPVAASSFVGVIGTASRSSAGNSSISITPSASVAAGDQIVVSVSAGTFAGAVGCTDTAGNTYLVRVDINASGGRLFICFGHAATGLTTSDSITATYPGFSGISLASASEIEGIFAGLIDGEASGNSDNPSVSVAVPYSAVVYGAIAYGSVPTFTAGCSGTVAGQVSAGSGSGKRTLVPLHATASSSADICGTLSSARPWLAGVIAVL